MALMAAKQITGSCLHGNLTYTVIIKVRVCWHHKNKGLTTRLHYTGISMAPGTAPSEPTATESSSSDLQWWDNWNEVSAGMNKFLDRKLVCIALS